MAKEKSLLFKIGSVIAYLAMITVNGLANGLPLNNRTTGAISDAYPNLFAPAGVTFSIWGLIYALLAAYVIYQFIPLASGKFRVRQELFDKINPYFIATSLFNIVWIFTWHYDFIGASLLLMVLLLGALIKIADILRQENFSMVEKILVRLPFSVYFGWISVATIANVTIFLVSVGWNGLGLSEELWLVAVLIIGTIIGLWRMKKDKNIPYGMVFIWAYSGILIKHIAPNGFNRQYGYAIFTALVCILLFIVYQAMIARKPSSFLDKLREKF